MRSARADATATEARLQTFEHRQRRVTAIVLSNRNQIAGFKQNLIDTRVGLDGTRSDKQRALVSVRSERQHLEGALSSLKAEQAKIQSTLQKAAGTLPAGAIKRGNGSMIWPVNGPITSPFCERRAWEACHPGIDIGVPSGTPIRAAASGKVTLMQSVGASGGYGNYTCVSHTSTLSTCYAHQSRFATSLGASVSQGQVIGYSGCTGLCFGRAPALRGAHQRRGHEPAELPLNARAGSAHRPNRVTWTSGRVSSCEGSPGSHCVCRARPAA